MSETADWFKITLLNSMSRRNGQYMHLMSLALCIKWLHWKYSFSFLLNVSVCSTGVEIRIGKWLWGRTWDEGKRPEKCQLRLLSLSVWLFSETLFLRVWQGPSEWMPIIPPNNVSQQYFNNVPLVEKPLSSQELIGF